MVAVRQVQGQVLDHRFGGRAVREGDLAQPQVAGADRAP
jgi:hypothetical protein